MEYFILFLTASMQAGMPLLFATLGETITEKSGNLNLGVEGMMLMGAVAGFMTGLVTANPVLAILASLLAGAAGAWIFAFLTVTLRANQVVTGLTLTIFGTGIAGYFGQSLSGKAAPAAIKAAFVPYKLPVLGDIPFIGPIFFHQDVLVYFGYFITLAMGIYIYKTRAGLNLRVVGENPAAADASGISVNRVKYAYTILGGALCGLGGAYLSLVSVPAWQENITAGRGWIAVALVIFTTWNPYKAAAGSYFFGALSIASFYLSKFNINISTYFLDMLPYAVTILVLIGISMRKSKENAPPQALGEPYFREER